MNIKESKIERGKVDVFITYENTGEGNVCCEDIILNSQAEYYDML